MKGNVTKTGYWPDSPDRNNDFNIIPSNNITMEGMDMPLLGISNTGDKKLMVPGKNYKFKGESVMETPVDKGMFLGRFKQVGGQLVPHDISVPNLNRQDGGGAKRFNTKLRGAELEAFNQHAQQFPSLATDTGDYDTQGFYKEVYNKNNGDMNAITAALTPGSPTAHVGNDRYKKPNHPTFSKESKYHIPVLRPAGEWGRNEQGDYFNASRRNIKNMTESDGTPLEYFKRAEDYNQNGVPDTQLLYRGQSMFNTDKPAYELPEMKPSKLYYSKGGSVKRVKIKSLPNNWKSQ